MDEAHTYFVGDGQWLVHNCPPSKTRQDYIDQSNRIRQERGIKPGKKNVGIADYDIDGETGTLVAISGQERANRKYPDLVQFKENPNSHIFKTFIAGGGYGPSDAEAKILEELSARLNPNSTGRIVLYTDRPACPSCNGVIDQFKERHPNVQVELIEGDLPLNRRED